jgi:Mn-dependent DtxR family transcriptional regulator
MSRKYRKINKYHVLNLFYDNEFILRADIIKSLNTSRYQVITALEDLIDDGLIIRTKLPGVKNNLPIHGFTLSKYKTDYL